jgi:hypothetical protein
VRIKCGQSGRDAERVRERRANGLRMTVFESSARSLEDTEPPGDGVSNSLSVFSVLKATHFSPSQPLIGLSVKHCHFHG